MLDDYGQTNENFLVDDVHLNSNIISGYLLASGIGGKVLGPENE